MDSPTKDFTTDCAGLSTSVVQKLMDSPTEDYSLQIVLACQFQWYIFSSATTSVDSLSATMNLLRKDFEESAQ